jgi:phosphatidylserine decarboxylase
MRFQTLYEGRHFLVPAILASVFFWWLAGDWSGWIWLAVPCTLVALFCANFFRDPERRIAGGDDIVVAAADGVVDTIEEVEETEFLNRRCKRVSIFLNVFDVHVNRAPIAGRITVSQHYPGTYLDARHPYCHQKNEALAWVFQGEKATVLLRQITGAIARRIVPWRKVGDYVAKGERFGMIRFGSRTDVYLPLDAVIKVELGQHVEGGATVLAELAAVPATLENTPQLETASIG